MYNLFIRGENLINVKDDRIYFRKKKLNISIISSIFYFILKVVFNCQVGSTKSNYISWCKIFSILHL